MRHNLSILTVLIAISILAVGCRDNQDNDINEGTILKPIAEHLYGKWLMTANSTFVNGKWKENENDENVSMVNDIRPDGSEVRVMTFPDGYTSLATTTWSVDEITGVFTDNGPLQLIKLTETEFIMEGETVIDPGTGESSEKKSRWTFNRISEQDKTLAEKMVGFWDVAKMYFLDGGEWKDSHRTGCWLNFMENGTMQEYLYNEIFTTQWSVNGKINDLRIVKSGHTMLLTVDMPDENNLILTQHYIDIQGIIYYVKLILNRRI